MTDYAALLFDLDGVLVDTRDWIRSAYRETAAQHGFTASDDALSALYGRPLHDCYRALSGRNDTTAYIACHRNVQHRTMDLQRLFPGAHETLAALRARGERLALVSARSGVSLRVTLDRFNLAPYFDRVVWPEECVHHKPHPEPVLLALNALNVSPRAALMVGDTANDIAAGQAAGCDTAGALYGFVGEAVRLARPTHLITALPDALTLRPQAATES